MSYYKSAEELSEYNAILIGVPTYHHDMPTGIKGLFEEAAVENVNLKDKAAVAFGSYGWSGEAPKLVLEIMKNRFAMNVLDQPLLVKYSPYQTALEKCRNLGKKVFESLIHKH